MANTDDVGSEYSSGSTRALVALSSPLAFARLWKKKKLFGLFALACPTSGDEKTRDHRPVCVHVLSKRCRQGAVETHHTVETVTGRDGVFKKNKKINNA